jgi:hypothetical protein
MIERAVWTKTLLDVLIANDWVELPDCRVRTWSSYMDNWRLKIEQHGKYPGYGWRIYRRTGRIWRSHFFMDEADVIKRLFGK